MGILLEELDAAAYVVGQREDLVELDLRTHTIALDDAVEPRSTVEDLGILAGLPLIDAARPAALAPDEVLADQSLHVLEPGRDLVKVLAAGGAVDVGRQLVADGGGDHRASSGRSSPRRGPAEHLGRGLLRDRALQEVRGPQSGADHTLD